MKRNALAGLCVGLGLVSTLVAGCGPEVNIVEPQEGDVLGDSRVTALLEFTAPARTFEVALDGNDVSGLFFVTDREAGGTLTGLSSGEHILQVSYTSTTGFSDTDSAVFTVQLEAVTVDSITVTPATLSLTVGETGQLAVIGNQSDGSTVDLTTDADTVYVSEDGTIVSVGTGGVLAAVGPGTATIGVQNGTQTALVTVTVTSADGAG